MGNWTKGPWTKSKVNPKIVNGNDDYYEILWSQDGELISDGVYGKANAQLISAAPDMAIAIETLLYALTSGDPSEVTMAKLNAQNALRKAKGE